jgi:hypothetical protein
MALRLPYAPATLCPQKYHLLFISVKGLVNPRALLLLEGLDKLQKKSMTASGIEPATLRLVA